LAPGNGSSKPTPKRSALPRIWAATRQT
jgi:hypothetical protein